MTPVERLALAPPRAVEPVAGRARIRLEPEDFEVIEDLGFEAAGQGPHLLLRVRKRNANTGWVARELARSIGVRDLDVGYAGLKDRHAVTTQWFTVPARGRSGETRTPTDWAGVQGEGYEVIEAHAHNRKLPRGALAGNTFKILLRDFEGDAAMLDRRVNEIARTGVPNYFGPQRFGRELSNLRRAETGRGGQGFVWSAMRGLLFNAVLAERIQGGSWVELKVGERANLDGRNSTFVVDAVDETIHSRLAMLDIHPTGPLFGTGEGGVGGDIAALESEVLARFPEFVDPLQEARLEPARRPLRVAVRDLSLEWLEPARTARLSFRLRPGSFATAVLRELLDVENAAGHSEDEHD
ncbi:MAG: tRNA pseudouridine(13) synthase TruD [Gammaproteobacteria bacterium]|nr:tRNA pseudouridine(13) synthase TruD [Gammaproteobacteria bacterium]